MTLNQFIVYIAAPLIGYFLGSIPFALLIGKAHGVDIRTTGSKNIGATNLGRTLGKKYFWQAFILDAAKGFVPVLLVALFVQHGFTVTSEIGPDMKPIVPPGMFAPHVLHGTFGIMIVHYPLPSWSPLLTAVACVLGHNFPLWLKFKGGKGVATSFGVVLGFWPLYTLAGIGAGLAFVFVLMVYRYISLASILAVLFFVGLVGCLGNWQNRYVDTYTDPADLRPLIGVAAVFAALIIFRHRANIGRLLRGTEPQIGQREKDKAALK